MRAKFLTTLVVTAATLSLTACNRGADPKVQAAPQVMPVSVEPVKSQSVNLSTEYLGTIKSLDATVLKPDVEGQITKIFVHSGEHVQAGQPLMVINPAKQEATVNTQEANRRARLAQLELNRIDLERKKGLFAAGVISKQDLDQAQSTYDSTKADAEALQAAVKEQREQLRYHNVAAPTDGTVGDIPVRVGDRVLYATQLTTIDSGHGLELYISIPAEKAPEVHLGTAIEILPDSGEGAPERTRITFISPRIDTQNQLLLVKAALPPDGQRFRNEQLLHARIVWKQTDLPVIPFAAVTRLSGNLFAFVSEQDGGKTVARQRRLEVGDMVGNSYTVLKGLKPGEQLITSNVQVLIDGMPVTRMPPAAEQGSSGSAADPPTKAHASENGSK